MGLCTRRKSTRDEYGNSRQGGEPIPRFYRPSRTIPPGSRNARRELVAIHKKGLGWPRFGAATPALRFFKYRDVEDYRGGIELDGMELGGPHVGFTCGAFVSFMVPSSQIRNNPNR